MMHQRNSAWRLTSRRPRCCTNPTLQEPERRIPWLMETSSSMCLEFTYLGRTIWSKGCLDDETQRRMAKASASFGRLRQTLWNNVHVPRRFKGKIYRAILLATFLYGTEAWAVYRWHVKKLNAFMMRHQCSIMRIIWMGKVTNKEILEWTSLDDLLISKNLRWNGHLLMMLPDRLPNQVLYSQLSSFQRKRGRPRLRFKDTININL